MTLEELWAKPIVDILVEIAPDENMQVVAGQIETCDFYECRRKKEGFHAIKDTPKTDLTISIPLSEKNSKFV